MSVNAEKAGFIKPAPKLSPRRFELRTFVGRLVGGFAWFAKLYAAALVAGHQAERHPLMSDAQLKKIRFSLDPTPHESTRKVTRD